VSGADPVVNLDEVAAAWKRHSDRIVTGRFTWTEQAADRGLKATGELSPEELRWSFTTTYLFDRGLRRRFHRVGLQPSPGSKSLMDLNNTYAYDGEDSKQFTPEGGRMAFPVGFVLKEDCTLLDYSNNQLLLALGKLDAAKRGVDPHSFRLPARSGVHEGRECVILQRPQDPTRPVGQAVWLDPARDYAIVRNERFSAKGYVRIVTDIDYRQDPEYGPLPARWTTTELSEKGNPQMVRVCEVTKYEINPALGEGDFQIDFPPGTNVYDERSGVRYLQRKNKKQRIITKGEEGATYQQLLDSESGQALVSSKRRGRHWLILVNAALAVVASVGWAVRNFRKRGHRVSDVLNRLDGKRQ
jgi:hypothetical protein